jgi:MoaA/NifB/PqqE/SkfB family radical SAM enzyme
MCDIWRANSQLREISVQELQPHIDGMHAWGVRWITLSGGEALMHTNLWNLCRALQPLGARITLLSTGLLLHKNLELIDKWVDEVIVSLDGGEAVHDQIRNIPRAYEKLQRGVSALREGAPGVEVGARCVLQRENYRDFANVVAAARSLNLDWISFLAADVDTEAFNRSGGWAPERVAEVCLTAEQCDEFENILRRSFVDLEQEYASGFIVESPDKLLALVQYYRAQNGSAEFPAHRCNAPWVSAVVEADGQVRPCFFHAPYGRLSETDKFVDIVNSPAAIRFRRELDMNSNAICKRCVCTLNFK